MKTKTHHWSKSLLAYLFAAAFFSGVKAGLADADETADANVILVDSFEDGEKVPTSWKQGPPIPGVKYVWDKQQASDGTRSLGFRKQANRFFPIAAWSRSIERTGDLPAVRVTANVKASKAAKAIMDVIFLDDKGEWIKHEWAVYIGQKKPGDPRANHDWKAYTGTVEIPENTQKIVIGLQMYGPGEVWFDELEVAYAEKADAE